MIKKVVILSVIFVLTLFFSYIIRNNADSNIEKTVLKFDENEYNFKKLKIHQIAETYFIYQNTGKHNLELRKISTGCGCAIPVWSRKELAPNEKDSIFIKYDTSESGYFMKEIMVFSNSKTSPDHLFIRGRVLQKEK